MTDEMKKKIEFVKKVNEAVTFAGKSVEQVNYKVFEDKEYPDSYREYVEVIYKGGARAVRNCSGNSCYAIFEEIARLLFGGYYSEVPAIEQIENDPRYVLVS